MPKQNRLSRPSRHESEIEQPAIIQAVQLTRIREAMPSLDGARFTTKFPYPVFVVVLHERNTVLDG
jgi:hypothetical protein